MEFYIIQKNFWFNKKLYEAGEYAKFAPADPEVQKLVEAGLVVSTGTLVDQSESVTSGDEEQVQEEVQAKDEVEPEPEVKEEDPKLIKKGKRK